MLAEDGVAELVVDRVFVLEQQRGAEVVVRLVAFGRGRSGSADVGRRREGRRGGRVVDGDLGGWRQLVRGVLGGVDVHRVVVRALHAVVRAEVAPVEVEKREVEGGGRQNVGHRVAQLERDGDEGVGKVGGDNVRRHSCLVAAVAPRWVQGAAKDGLDVVRRLDLENHVEITPVDGHDALEARLSGRARVLRVDCGVGNRGAGPPEVEDVGRGARRTRRRREPAERSEKRIRSDVGVQGQCEFERRAVEAYGGGEGGGGSDGSGGAEGGMKGHVHAKKLPSTGSTVSVTSVRRTKSETPKPPVAWRRRRPADAAMVVEATHAW